MTDRCLEFAQRLQSERETLEQHIQRAYSLTYGRLPSRSALSRLKKYVAEMREYHSKVEPVAVDYQTELVRTLVEEFSGEPFNYVEKLPVFEAYQADTKAADVDVNTRALADLCLLLFNSSEFMYLY